MKDVRNETRLADNLCAGTSKALGVAKQKNKELGMKLATEVRG